MQGAPGPTAPGDPPVPRPAALLVASLLLLGGATVAEARTIDGDSRANRLTGTNGSDLIRGGRGSDRIDGRGGNDTIAGGGGNDTIVGGSGRDTISGGGGRDRIDVRDGAVDRVVCGREHDVVLADRVDLVNAGDCDDVRR